MKCETGPFDASTHNSRSVTRLSPCEGPGWNVGLRPNGPPHAATCHPPVTRPGMSAGFRVAPLRIDRPPTPLHLQGTCGFVPFVKEA